MAFGPKSKKRRAFTRRQAAFFAQAADFNGAQDLVDQIEDWCPGDQIVSIDLGTREADRAAVLAIDAGYRPSSFSAEAALS